MWIFICIHAALENCHFWTGRWVYIVNSKQFCNKLHFNFYLVWEEWSNYLIRIIDTVKRIFKNKDKFEMKPVSQSRYLHQIELRAKICLVSSQVSFSKMLLTYTFFSSVMVLGLASYLIFKMKSNEDYKSDSSLVNWSFLGLTEMDTLVCPCLLYLNK